MPYLTATHNRTQDGPTSTYAVTVALAYTSMHVRRHMYVHRAPRLRAHTHVLTPIVRPTAHMYTHVQIQIYAHAHTTTYTCVYICTVCRMLPHTNSHMHARSLMHARSCTHSRSLILMNAHSCSPTREQISAHTLVHAPSFTHLRAYTLMHAMNCDLKNCIYVIRCAGCSQYYIGKIVDFRLCTNLHKHHIRCSTGLDVFKYIYECTRNKTIIHNFSIMPFYKIRKNDQNYRKIKESYFIKILKPKLNVSREAVLANTQS